MNARALLILAALTTTVACDAQEAETSADGADSIDLATETSAGLEDGLEGEVGTAMPVDALAMDPAFPAFGDPADMGLPRLDIPSVDRPLPGVGSCLRPLPPGARLGLRPRAPLQNATVRPRQLSGPMGLDSKAGPRVVLGDRPPLSAPIPLDRCRLIDDGPDPADGPGVCAQDADFWMDNSANWMEWVVVIGDAELDQDQAMELLEMPVDGDGMVELAAQLITAELNMRLGLDDSAAAKRMDRAHEVISLYQQQHGQIGGDEQCAAASCLALSDLAFGVAASLEEWNTSHCE